jgi:hypothetical protein
LVLAVIDDHTRAPLVHCDCLANGTGGFDYHAPPPSVHYDCLANGTGGFDYHAPPHSYITIASRMAPAVFDYHARPPFVHYDCFANGTDGFRLPHAATTRTLRSLANGSGGFDYHARPRSYTAIALRMAPVVFDYHAPAATRRLRVPGEWRRWLSWGAHGRSLRGDCRRLAGVATARACRG